MENFKETIGLLSGYLIILISLACSAPKSLPPAEPMNLTQEDLKEGRKLFASYCDHCHPNGMAGVGLAIINKPIPKFIIRFQVRNGIGLMPAFKEEIISDDQLNKITDYIKFLESRK